MNDSYRYFSGENEIIARLEEYELADNYGLDVVKTHVTHEPIAGPVHMRPDITVPAPEGKKFLFVYFTFFNAGNTTAHMPPQDVFRIESTDGISLSPAGSIRNTNTRTVAGTNGNIKPMFEYAAYFNSNDLYPNVLPLPGWNWYIPFIVPDTFDPAKSYVSVRFNENNSAVWRFS